MANKFCIWVLLVTFNSGLLTACSPTRTPNEHLEMGQNKFQQKEYAQAIIHLKNVISLYNAETNVDLEQAKYLLAKSYDSVGKQENAERFWVDITDSPRFQVEAIKALSQYYFEEANLVSLADLIAKYLGKNVDTDPLLSLYQVLLAQKSNEPKNARALLSQLTTETLASPLGQYTQAFVNSETDPQSAVETISKLILSEPDYKAAWLLRGQIHASNAKYNDAYRDYSTYLTLNPTATYVHFLLALTAQHLDKYELMQKHVAVLLKQNPEQPLSNHLQALIFYRQSNFELTKFHAELSIQNGLANSTNALMAGIAAANLEQFEVAFNHLERLQDEFANHQGFLRVFSWVQLNLGLLNDAVAKYNEINVDTDSEFHLGNLLVDQLIAKKQLQTANELLEKLQFAPVSNPMLKLKQGILQLNAGNKHGLEIIQGLAQEQKDNVTIKMAHILSLADQGKYDDAMKQAIDWHLDDKNNVLAVNVIALLHQQNKQFDLAAKWLRHSLQLQPKNVPALLHLGYKALDDKDSSTAKHYFEQALQLKPNHKKAITGLLKLKANDNNAISTKQLMASINFNGDAMPAIIAITQYLYQDGQYDKLRELIKSNIEITDWTLEIWQIWLRAQIATNQLDLKDDLYLFSNRFPAEETYLYVISLIEDQRQYDLILTYISWLESHSKSSNNIQYAKANALLYTGDLATAEFLITQLSEKPPLPALMWLKGKLLIEQGKTSVGLLKVANYFNQYPTRSAMIELATAAKQQGHFDHLVIIAHHYFRQSPNDHNARAMVSNWLIQNAPKAAIAILDVPQSRRFILQHWQISNNLAWLYLSTNKPKNALVFAEQAYLQQPKNPQVVINYARILKTLGEVQKAVQTLKRFATPTEDMRLLLKELGA